MNLNRLSFIRFNRPHMETPLRILLLEDNVPDVALFKKYLALTSVPVEEVYYTSTLELALASLSMHSPDVIMIELMVQDSQGLDTLSSIIAHAPDVPVIVFCPAHDRRVGLKTLANGAHDYIMKGSYDEYLLEKTIRLALQRKHAFDLAERSRQNYQNVFESNPMPCWAIDPATMKVKMVNAAAINHYGYSREEFLDMDIRRVHPPDQVERVTEIIAENTNVSHFSTGQTDWRHITKDGKFIDVEVSAVNVIIDGTPLTLAVINDVTEKKKALSLLAEHDQRLNLAVAAGRMMTMDVDFTSKKIRLSGHGKEVIGLDKETELHLNDAAKFIHPDDHVKLHEALRLTQSGKRSDFQFRLLRPDTGKTVWLERRSEIVKNEAGVPVRSRGVLVDITALKETQDHLLVSLKQLEEAAARQTSILNSLPAHIAMLDSDGRIMTVNESWKSFADNNGPRDDNYWVGRSYFAGDETDENIKAIHTGIRKVLWGNADEFSVEYPCHSPTEQRWFKAIASPFAFNDKRGAVVMHVNITDRKLAEDALLKSRADVFAIFNNTEDAYTLVDSDYRVIAFNRKAAETVMQNVGKSFAEGVSMVDFLPPHRVDNFYKQVEQARSGKTVQYEAEYDTLSLGKKWLHVRVIPVPTGDNGSMRFIFLARDFTKEKKAETALKEKEERFRALIENSGDMFTITDALNTIKYASPNIEKFLSNEEGQISRATFDTLIHPDDREEYGRIYRKVSVSESLLFHFKLRMSLRKDYWIWVEGTITNLTHIPSVNGVVTNFRDVTEKIRTEEELERSRYVLEKATSVARIGYWTSGIADDSELVWSSEIFSIVGIPEDNLTRKVSDFYAIVHPEDLPQVKAAKQRALTRRGEYDIDHRVLRRDGTVIWVHQQAEVFFDGAGKPVSMIGVAQDITERKQNEEVLRKSKQNLDALINNTNDFIWSCNRDLQLISANRAFRKEVYSRRGVALEEGDSLLVMDPESESYKFWFDRYQEALSGRTLQFEYSLPNDNGAPKFFDVTLNPVIDGQEVVGVCGFIRDVSEKKKDEADLRLVNERYELLSIATNDAVWDWDMLTEKVHWNHGLQSIFGYPNDHRTTSFTWWETNVHPDDADTVHNTLHEAFAVEASNWSVEYRFKCLDGAYKYVHDRGYVIYKHGKPIRMIGTMQDVHELTEYRLALEHKVRERTRELHQALEKEKELSEMKSRFVSIASHEFRTPLSAIQFAADFVQLYRQKADAAEIDGKLQNITVQVQHMMSLLDDVLTVGKADAGKIAVNSTRIDIKAFFKQLTENVRDASKSSHEIVANYKIANRYLQSDEKLLFNIFSNLLSNAIKFSPGERQVYFNCFEQFGYLIVEVGDNGIGIDPEESASLFEAFTRGSNVGAIPGTGLGLSIVKTAVDLLEGEIELTRTEVYNTVFRVRLPRWKKDSSTKKIGT